MVDGDSGGGDDERFWKVLVEMLRNIFKGG